MASSNDISAPWLAGYLESLPQAERPYFLDFFPEWLQLYLGSLDENERKDFLAQYEEAFRESMAKLESVPVNLHRDGTEEGEFSVRVGDSDVFVNVKKAVWTTAKYAGPLILAAAISPALLVHLGITAAALPHLSVGTTASASIALYQSFAKLSPSELDTYQAVAVAIQRNKNRILANSGASIEDVRESFRRDAELFPPQDLRPTLDQLVAKFVLEKKVIGGVEQYFIAF